MHDSQGAPWRRDGLEGQELGHKVCVRTRQEGLEVSASSLPPDRSLAFGHQSRSVDDCTLPSGWSEREEEKFLSSQIRGRRASSACLSSVRNSLLWFLYSPFMYSWKDDSRHVQSLCLPTSWRSDIELSRIFKVELSLLDVCHFLNVVFWINLLIIWPAVIDSSAFEMRGETSSGSSSQSSCLCSALQQTWNKVHALSYRRSVRFIG